MRYVRCMMIYRQRRHSHVGRPQVDIVSASYPFYSVYIVDIAMLAIQSIGYRVNIVPLLSSLHRRHRNDRWPTSSRRHRVSIIPLISFLHHWHRNYYIRIYMYIISILYLLSFVVWLGSSSQSLSLPQNIYLVGSTIFSCWKLQKWTIIIDL